MMNCAQTRALLEKAFILKDAALLDKIRPHLAGCPNCQLTYEHLFEAEVALVGLEETQSSPESAGQLLTPTEKELLLGRILPRAQTLRSRKHKSFRRRAYALAAATSALLVVALLSVLPRHAPRVPPTRSDEFGARGSSARNAAVPVGLRALCLAHSSQGIQVRTAGTNPCLQGESLGFAYRNESGRRWYLRVVLVDAEKHQRQVFPMGKKSSKLVDPVDDETPLASTMTLEQVKPGRASVFGFFSRRPLDHGIMQEMIEAGASSSTPQGAGEVHLVRLELKIGQ